MGVTALGLLAGDTSVSANTTTQGGITYPPGQDPKRSTFPLGADPCMPGQGPGQGTYPPGAEHVPPREIPSLKKENQNLKPDLLEEEKDYPSDRPQFEDDGYPSDGEGLQGDQAEGDDTSEEQERKSGEREEEEEDKKPLSERTLLTCFIKGEKIE